MRDLKFEEVQTVNGGGEITPAEGATLEIAVAAVALAVGAPVLALAAIGAAALLYATD